MKVLLVDDESRVREGLERILPQVWSHDDELEIISADSGPAALACMEFDAADLVLTDMRMPGMDGAQVLARVSQRWPAAMRVVLSGYMEDDVAIRSARFAHQFLTKPCPPAALEGVLDRAYGLTKILSCAHTRRVVGSLGSLPAAPRVYVELKQLLDASDADLRAISRVVERDPALTAKTLQLVNSAFFSRRAPVSGVTDAVARIGLRTMQALAASAALYDAVSEGASGELVDAIQRRASTLARVASDLGGPAAFLPAMLCDLGLLVLHTRRLEDDEGGLGAHPRVGAYLLTLWGFDDAVVDMVMRHHEEPPEGAGPVAVAVSFAARWLEGTITDGDIHARYGRVPDRGSPT
jgi:HD-like signal output (HDOD) protein/ActR/RegA family two-component response regulator